MDIEKFAEEMVISQNEKKLTDYCKKHWDEALEFFPEDFLTMDSLIDLAVKVGTKRSTSNLNAYSNFVEKFKEQE